MLRDQQFEAEHSGQVAARAVMGSPMSAADKQQQVIAFAAPVPLET